MPRTERVTAKTGGTMSAIMHSLRSWRWDLDLFLTELFPSARVAKKVPMFDNKNTPAITKLEPRNSKVSDSRLGPTLLVKGEIFGNEDLLIEGSVEGVIRLNERKLMIGPAAIVRADIIAGDVVIRGNLKGNVRAKGWIEIGNDGSVTGDLTTPQIFIEDGALFKGSIEIEKNAEKQSHEDVFPQAKSVPANVAAAGAGVSGV